MTTGRINQVTTVLFLVSLIFFPLKIRRKKKRNPKKVVAAKALVASLRYFFLSVLPARQPTKYHARLDFVAFFAFGSEKTSIEDLLFCCAELKLALCFHNLFFHSNTAFPAVLFCAPFS
ncbi:hypothetical protein QOT17_016713 [Balamuthia mandrillaris]